MGDACDGCVVFLVSVGFTSAEVGLFAGFGLDGMGWMGIIIGIIKN